VNFDVESLRDLNQSDFVQALRRFSQRADGADLALFFYAGHGVQANDVNSLLPVGANPQRLEDLRGAAIEVGAVLFVLVLVRVGGNQVIASQLLGIARSTLRSRISDLGLTIAKRVLPDDGE
jgi:DNA-binding protein Fis